MSENPGGTPPRDDDPSVPPPPPPGPGQPTGGVPPTPPPYGTPAGGAYPPPAGGAPGGYPPPASPYGTPGGAPGGYPPPASPYGQAPGTGVGVGEAFNWGWTKFQQNVGTILLAMLLWLVGLAVVVGIWYGLLGAIGLGFTATDEYGMPAASVGAFSGAFFVAFSLFGIVAFLAGFLFQAGVTRAALHVTHGRPLELRTFFAFEDIGKVLLTSLLLGLASAVIGGITCGVGSILVSFFGTFALHFVLDKRLGAVDAIRASITLVNRNVGTIVVLVLAVYVAGLIGAALCAIGTLVTTPVSLLAVTYVYRRLQGEPVAA